MAIISKMHITSIVAPEVFKSIQDSLHAALFSPSIPVAELQNLTESVGLSLQDAQSLSGSPGNPGAELSGKIFALAALLNARLARSNESAKASRTGVDNTNMALARFISSCSAAMYITDYDTGDIIMVNKAYCEIAGLSEKEVVGQKCWAVNHGQKESFCPSCPREELLAPNREPGSHSITREYYNERLGRWLRCIHKVIRWTDGRLAKVVTKLDITQEKNMRAELEHIAFYDSHTSLPNQAKLLHDLKDCLAELAWSGAHAKNMQRIGLLCFDLSSMRFFNDNYGSETGEKILQAIIKWFREHSFPQNSLYRLDGYEFCLVFKNSSTRQLKNAAQTIAARFARSWLLKNGGRDDSYYCAISQAILFASGQRINNGKLMPQISHTLELARKSKNIVIYDAAMEAKHKEAVQLELSLEQCVANNMRGFDVYFQPIVETSTGTWKGLEALCRWTSPELGAVSPAIFIHKAERIGLVSIIGNWVLEQAVCRSKELGLDLLDGYFLSVNVSPIQFMDETFSNTVAAILQNYNYPGNKLNLEFTESTQINFSAVSMSSIQKLREHGIKMALDDFGTGYSSFNNLKNLPVEYLKTEREFISGIEDDSYMQYCFYIMSELAHANGMELVAEGVETAEQFKVVRKNGADYVQGYFFSRPLSVDQLRENLLSFSEVDSRLLPARAESINLQQWLSGKNAYALTPNLFRLLSQCMNIIATEADIDAAFYQTLEIVGTHFGAGRAVCMIYADSGKNNTALQWCSGRMEKISQKNSDRSLPINLEILRNSGTIMYKGNSPLAPAFSRVLTPDGAKSFLKIPLWGESDIIGFLAFHESQPREWSPEEVVILSHLSLLMSNSLKRKGLEMEIQEKNRMLSQVLNSGGMGVIVADAESNEILWVNDVMKSKYKMGPYMVGRKCHEVIQGKNEPCESCRVQELLENPQLDRIGYEHHNECWNKSFLIYSSVVQWGEERKLHVAYCMDTTEQKNIERQAEYYATTDPLTGALSRSTAITKLNEMARRAYKENSGLCVAYISMDKLRTVNRSFGHQAGDRLLRHTADAIRGALAPEDILGRMGGDEFLVIFPGCGRQEAAKRLNRAAELMRDALLPAGGGSFSTGMAEKDEIASPYLEANPDGWVDAFLNRAELQLSTHKHRIAPLLPGVFAKDLFDHCRE